uniref:Calmodulin binding transcription activator 1 n=1 Tax=Hucho hucho TaxID=62062 RepID=A0A4W5LPY5_9TELE
ILQYTSICKNNTLITIVYTTVFFHYSIYTIVNCTYYNEHGHLKIYLPKKLLECLPKCSSLPKERHRWNTNEHDVLGRS